MVLRWAVSAPDKAFLVIQFVGGCVDSNSDKWAPVVEG